VVLSPSTADDGCEILDPMPARTTPVTVAVVDDQLGFRVAAAAVADMTDGFVLAAGVECGEAAVELIGQRAVDLILMDVNMPGIGGLQAAQIIRDREPATLVVLVSTYDATDLPVSVRTSGFAYLSKQTLTPELLMELWDTHVNSSKAQT
jgi:two-component system, NarL family, invasion response regulator UvrY